MALPNTLRDKPLSSAERRLRREAAAKWQFSRRDARRWILLERVRVNASSALHSPIAASLAEEAAARQSDLGQLSVRAKECDIRCASLSEDWRSQVPFLQQRRTLLRTTASLNKHQRRLDAYRREIDEFFTDSRLASLCETRIGGSAAPKDETPASRSAADYPVLNDVIVLGAFAPGWAPA